MEKEVALISSLAFQVVPQNTISGYVAVREETNAAKDNLGILAKKVRVAVARAGSTRMGEEDDMKRLQGLLELLQYKYYHRPLYDGDICYSENMMG